MLASIQTPKCFNSLDIEGNILASHLSNLKLQLMLTARLPHHGKTMLWLRESLIKMQVHMKCSISPPISWLLNPKHLNLKKFRYFGCRRSTVCVCVCQKDFNLLHSLVESGLVSCCRAKVLGLSRALQVSGRTMMPHKISSFTKLIVHRSPI